MLNKLAIIVQARMQSTRLRGKVLKEIYHDKTILDLIIHNLKKLNQKIIIATSKNKADDLIVKRAISNNVEYFRGDEQNVLKRYIDCANEFGVMKIIRITSDNVFVQPVFIEALIENIIPDIDYLTYTINGKNVVLTHWGLFGEFVTINALKKVAEIARDKEDFEHVTYYIYHHPDEFKIKLLDVPQELNRTDIRLTIDTKADFELCKKIVFYLKEQNLEWHYGNILDYINENVEIKQKMKKIIKTIQESKN